MPRYLLLLMFISMMIVFPACAQEPNLAVNPGFEKWPEPVSGDAVWAAEGYSIGVEGRDGSAVGRAYRTGEGELDTERRSGKYAQYIRTTTWGRGAIARGVAVTAGHRYRVSIWVKVLSGKFQLGVCYAHAPWTYLGDWEYSLPADQWVQVVKEVVIPEECKSIAAVMFLQNGSMYLDDLEITDLGPAGQENSGADTMPLAAGSPAPEITRRRVVVFDEPGFPAESPRSAEWYATVLQEAGLEVTRLGSDALRDAGRFSRDLYDTLILPTGGNFPAPAEAAIEEFLARGGTLLIDENFVFRTTPRPNDDTAGELERLHQEYLAGNGGYAYFDFLSRNMWHSHGNMFDRDDATGTWHTQIHRIQNYEGPNAATYPEGLGLRPWPNTGQPFYARPIAAPLQRNPALDAVLADFPASVPADEDPRAARGALRLCREGRQTIETGTSPEHHNDLLLCLYHFPEFSGLNYPAFPDASKSPRDKEGDFYVMRYHNARMAGGTLVHFGSVGARLLAGPDGPAVLLASLRLAESELPGESPPEFVQTANEARDLFSRYCGLSIALRELLVAIAAMNTYAGDGAEADAASGEFAREKARFEELSRRSDHLEELLGKRDDNLAHGHNSRRALVADLESEIARLNPMLAEMQSRQQTAASPPDPIPVEHPFGHLFFGLDNTLARGALGLAEFRRQIEQMGLRFEGYRLTSYRHEYTFNNHPFKRTFESGILDPVSGVVTPREDRWPETAEDQANWQESFRWQLERMNRDPEINLIYGMDERDFEWSLWGPRDRLLFLDYLRDIHGDIGTLNTIWGTAHDDFTDIALPVSRPVSQSEHALWEDWTRFREVYRLHREIRLSTEIVLRHAPDQKWRYLTWCTYNQHGVQPANGINFYEYGKELPVNGFEHSNEDAKEWLAFDICSMFSLHSTAEWGSLYFPPATHQAKVDLLSERIWKGLANGQVGWSLYIFSSPRDPASNSMDLMNRPLPLGWQLAEEKRRGDLLEHILLDGSRDEPPVRIVYSPTTRRHTSWPGIERDISFRATGGLYTLFRNSHLHARAIDEQAVWEGHLPEECRLLILSEVLYENEALHEKVSEYLEAGGNVLVTLGSGRFDQYGRPRDTWLKKAGVVPRPVSEKVIPLADGVRYFSSANADKMAALDPVFPDEVRVLARFADGRPALTETAVGEGKLFVVGCDLGLDADDQYKGNPGPLRALLAPVLQSAGIEQEVQISRQDMMVRPWQYKGDRYLLLACMGREGISDYDLRLQGSWEVHDYLLGLPINVTHKDGQTHLSGVIASPGGAVLALQPAAAQAQEAAPAAPQPVPAVAPPAPDEAPTVLPLDTQTPYEGHLWARDGTIRLGDFSLQLDVETGGGWGGNCFLTARLGKEQQRKRCIAGQRLDFYFTDQVLSVECLEVTSVYPSNIVACITVEERTVQPADCLLVREPFHGQDSIVMTNGLLRARILPELGGRLIELTTLPDETPHLFADPEIIQQGIGTAWADFGGLEENAGGFPGPYWNANFAVNIVEETPERIVVRLSMGQPVEWAYGYANPKSGRNRLVKQYTLRRGESCLEAELEAYNEAAATMPVGLRTHPVWHIGGDGDPGDFWVVRIDGQIESRRYPFPGTFPAEGDWTALVDRPKRMALIQGFDPEAVDFLYTHTPPGKYGLELFAHVREIPAGEALPLVHSLALVQGLGGVDAHRDGLALHVDTGEVAAIGQDEPLDFAVETGSIRAQEGTLAVEVHHGNEHIAAVGSVPLSLQPGQALTHSFQWSAVDLTDGEYTILARFTPAEGEALDARRTITLSHAGRQKQLDGLAVYEEHIEGLRQAYLDARGADAPQARLRQLREYAVSAALLLGELRELIAVGNTEESQVVKQRLRRLLQLP